MISTERSMTNNDDRNSVQYTSLLEYPIYKSSDIIWQNKTETSTKLVQVLQLQSKTNRYTRLNSWIEEKVRLKVNDLDSLTIQFLERSLDAKKLIYPRRPFYGQGFPLKLLGSKLCALYGTICLQRIG